MTWPRARLDLGRANTVSSRVTAPCSANSITARLNIFFGCPFSLLFRQPLSVGRRDLDAKSEIKRVS